jgi:tetratricopeptide (TPR) repeat protein
VPFGKCTNEDGRLIPETRLTASFAERNMYTCYFCGDHQPLSEVEDWSLARVSFQIPKSTVAWACVDSSVGELWICQKCYSKNVFRSLRAGDKAEIHYQMALEYGELGEYPKSIAALSKALKLRKTADILSSLALNYSRVGDAGRARYFYELALKLKPDHFMASENLKKLLSETSKPTRGRRSRRRH